MNKTNGEKSKVREIANIKVKFNVNEIELTDLKWYNKMLALGLLLIQIFNLCIIFDDMIYKNVAKIILVLAIINCILMLMYNENKPKKTLYLFGMIHLNLVVFTIYIFYLNFISIKGEFAKTLFILEYVIIQLLLIYKRLINKNEDFISSIGTNEVKKYIKKDLIMCIIISLITVIVAKTVDGISIFSNNIEMHMSIVGIISTLVIPSVSTASIFGLAAVRYKKIVDKKN